MATMRDVHGKFIAVHETEDARHRAVHKRAHEHYTANQPPPPPPAPKDDE